MRRFLAAAWLLAVAAAHAQTPRLELPDMGSSAGSVLAPGEERRIREELRRELHRLGLVIEDPLVEEYLAGLGFRLVAASDAGSGEFLFLPLRLRSINAFAAPGGLIAAHAGLVLAAEREDELAAVLAHEVAHVTQRHILRRQESMQRVSLPILLGMLGALAASAGRTDDAAESAIVGGLALLEQQAINYTRQNEYEADRVGIQILARAGFDPLAMAGIFQRLARASRGPEQSVPEYLRTHPVTTTRIAEARTRAEAQVRPASGEPLVTRPLHPALPTRGAAALPPAAAADPLRFRLTRERLRVLTAARAEDALAYYRALRPEDRDADPARRYGEALAALASGRAAEAKALAHALLAADPGRLEFRLLAAEALARLGDPGARARLAELAADHPAHPAVLLAFAEHLLESGEREAALEAQGRLRPLLQRSPAPRLYRVFARAAELAGDEIRAAEAHAEAAFLAGELEDALRILQQLARRDDLDRYQRARIDARIADLTPLVLDLRRRLVRAPDDQAG
ncbi:MAG: M48 family metalloprotease [Xanthomonadales bacterium]|nr:M48 family metalloprotease [Xanthomonadales bacterium]